MLMCIDAHLETGKNMTEKDVKLLKMALSIGWKAIGQIYSVADYCENMDNDYFLMIQRLAEIIGENLDDVSW